MTCSACVQTAENALRQVRGVTNARVFLLSERAEILHDKSTANIASLIDALDSVGFDATLVESVAAPSTTTTTPTPAITASTVSVTIATPFSSTAIFSVDGMTCAACTSTATRALEAIPSVTGVAVALLASRATIRLRYDGSGGGGTDGGAATARAAVLAECADALESVGFEASLISCEDDCAGSNEENEADSRVLAVLDIKLGTGMLAAATAPAPAPAASTPLALALGINELPGVEESNAGKSLNGDCATLTVLFNPRAILLRRIVDTVGALGWQVTDMTARIDRGGSLGASFIGGTSSGTDTQRIAEGAKREADAARTQFAIAAFFAFPVFVMAMAIERGKNGGAPWGWAFGIVGLSTLDIVQGVLTVPVQFGVGARFYRGACGYSRAKNGRLRLRCSMGMDILIAVGTSCAFFASVLEMILGVMAQMPPMALFFETSALLIAFVVLGKWLENLAKGSTAHALTALVGLAPADALLVVENEEEAIFVRAQEEKAEAELVNLLDVEKVEENKLVGDDLKSNNDGVTLVSTNAAPLTRRVPIRLLARGDLVRVLSGAAFPCDGIVEAGATDVDESLVTGEPMPALRSVGDVVIGGTVNVGSVAVAVRATKTGASSLLSQIVALVETASLSRAPLQNFADAVSAVFAPIVLLLAAVTFIGWAVAAQTEPTVAHWSMLGMGDGSSSGYMFALRFAIAVVVVACPCALGLATPTAIMVGTGAGARLGVLVKGGAALELAAAVRAIVFDKTGTLTEGHPSLVAVALLPQKNNSNSSSSSSSSNVAGDDGTTEVTRLQIFALLAAAESGSEHPLAKALVNGARYAAGCPLPSWDVPPGALVSTPGAGVTALVETPNIEWESLALVGGGKNGGGGVFTVTLPGDKGGITTRQVLVGTRAHLASHEIATSPLAELALTRAEVAGRTAVLMSVDHVLVAVLSLIDAPRLEARAVIAALGARDLDCAVYLLSGDAPATVARVGALMGIPPERIFGGVGPADKAGKIKELKELIASQTGGGGVAMVGDGVNDAAALAAASVGIAIGAGASMAVAAADVVLLRAGVRDVITALKLSRAVASRIKLNFVWALGYNLLALPLAAGILFPATQMVFAPEAAALAMALSSVSVVLSSLLLRRFDTPYIPGAPLLTTISARPAPIPPLVTELSKLKPACSCACQVCQANSLDNVRGARIALRKASATIKTPPAAAAASSISLAMNNKSDMGNENDALLQQTLVDENVVCDEFDANCGTGEILMSSSASTASCTCPDCQCDCC